MEGKQGGLFELYIFYSTSIYLNEFRIKRITRKEKKRDSYLDFNTYYALI